MIDRNEIENLIDELLDEDVTLSTCGDLANLYILLDHLPTEVVEPNDDIYSLLVDYMCQRDLVHLNRLLTKLCDTLSEVYHTIDTEEERCEFKEFVERVNSISTPTVLS